MRGGGKGMVLEWRGLECFVCFGQGPSVLQGQGLQSLAQLPPSLHGDWENGAAGDGGRGVGMPSTWGCGGMWELLPWLRVHPARGCVLGAEGPGLCWSTRLYSVLPGSPTLVAAHAAPAHEFPQS